MKLYEPFLGLKAGITTKKSGRIITSFKAPRGDTNKYEVSGDKRKLGIITENGLLIVVTANEIFDCWCVFS